MHYFSSLIYKFSLLVRRGRMKEKSNLFFSYDSATLKYTGATGVSVFAKLLPSSSKNWNYHKMRANEPRDVHRMATCDAKGRKQKESEHWSKNTNQDKIKITDPLALP